MLKLLTYQDKPNGIKLAVELAKLLKEGGEQAVWQVLVSHYEENHGTKITRICEACDQRGVTHDGEKETTCNCCTGKGQMD